jgi:3-hydroxybutyryl-CoA dehydrogenase
MNKAIKKVAVIGTGTLGTQIAMQAARANYLVKTFDVKKGSLENTLKTIKGLEKLVPTNEWATCQEKIQAMETIEAAIGDADLVIEAVPEDLNLKRAVWEDIGRKANPNAILATNSSSIPVSRLEESSGNPERCLNLHFYIGMNMADVMEGTSTRPQVIEEGISWIRSLDCIPLTVKKELLGFCFNRVWRAVKREVLSMWANGYVDFRDVDRAWMIFNGMSANSDRFGPFALMDKVGLDVIYDIEMVYYNDSKDPKDHPPKELKEKIERGELGVKSGKGFYSYPDPEYMSPDFLNPFRRE